MKKITALLTAITILISSCEKAPVSEESEVSESGLPEHISEITSSSIDLDNLVFEYHAGIVDSSLRLAGEISEYRTYKRGEKLPVPKSCIYGDYTYIMRSCPGDITEYDEYRDFKDSGNCVREIEVYKNHDYTEPAEIIPLTGLEGILFSVLDLSFDSEENCFYILLNVDSEDGYCKYLYRFSPEGEYISSGKLENQKATGCFVCRGMVYYVMNGGRSGSTGELVCEDPFHETKSVISESVMYASVSDNEICYIKTLSGESGSSEAAMFSYDSESGEEKLLAYLSDFKNSVTGENSISGACWDAENEIMYISYAEDLYVVRNGEKKNVIKVCETPITPLYIQDGYIVVQADCQVCVYILEDNPDSLDKNMITLRIYCSHGKGTDSDSENFLSFLTYALDAMNSAGIAVELEVAYNAAPDEYKNTMAKKFLSGDEDYDLFFVSSEMTNLFDSRYYEDLYQYSVLRDRYDHMIPGLKELCCIDGKAVLIPYVDVLTNSLVINNTLLGKDYTFAGDYNSFFEFHDMIAENVPDGETYNTAKNEYKYFDYWFDEIYSNFMARTISDDTAQSDTLRLFEDIRTRCGNEELSEITKNSNCYAMDITANAGGAGRYDEAVFPKLGEDYKFSFDLSAIAVNPKSPNKDIAVAFLAYYCNVLANNLRTNTRILRLFDDKIEEYGESSVSQVYRSQMENSIHRSVNKDFSLMCHNLKRSIISGEITPSEAAAEAFRYMKMARDE